MGNLFIISCGVEGAERGGLFGANKVGLDTGGWIPQGSTNITWNETSINGYPPWVELLNLKISKHKDHWACAKRRIRNSDGVLLVGLRNTQHAKLVIGECEESKKPILKIRYRCAFSDQNSLLVKARTLAAWVYNHDIVTLYITGDTEEANFGVEGFTETLVITAYQEMRRPGSLPEGITESKRERKRRERWEEKRAEAWR